MPPRPVRLRDGSRVAVRPIHPQDKDLLAGAFERLSEESRYRRFFAPVHFLSEDALRFLTEVDHHDHVEVELDIELPPEQGMGRELAEVLRGAAASALHPRDTALRLARRARQLYERGSSG